MSTEPDPAPPPEPATFWQRPADPGTPGIPAPAPSRPAPLWVWVVATVGYVVVAFAVGRMEQVAERGAGVSDAYAAGRQVGSLVGALLVALAVRWLWVRVRGGGRVLSPWILGIAAVLVMMSAVGTAGRARGGDGGAGPEPGPRTPPAVAAARADAFADRLALPASLTPASHCSRWRGDPSVF